jgi:hypothetical protein
MLASMLARFLAVVLALLAIAVPARAQSEGVQARVVVELYTSQGCTQCPRANRLLGTFAREDDVLALTFPVGIWDYLGWRDTFARPEFAERQRVYSTSLRVRGRFTPQLVINGVHQMSASDWDQARAAFAEQQSAAWPAGAPSVAISRLRNNRVRVTVSSNPDPSHSADLWLVAFDPGPVTVVVTGGANINRSVAHYNLVRTIERLGTWEGSASWYERAHCSPECAVIVQSANGGRILAAAYTTPPGRY